MKFNNCEIGQKVRFTYSFTIILLTAIIAFGTTVDVGGTLDSGQWNADTVRVTDNIILPSGATLQIDPGVSVIFTGPYSFIVNGELKAIGTFEDPILFTAEQPENDDLRWKGIRLINAARDCELSFCRIEYGWARGEWPENCGGGLYLEGSSPVISRCTISNNLADSDGGGVYGWFTTLLFQNSIIDHNRADGFGGGLFLSYSDPSLINLTIVSNNAWGWGGGIYAGAEATPKIKNCILNDNVENEDQDINPGDAYSQNLGRARSSVVAVTYSLIRHAEDPFPGAGNIFQNPLFVNDTEEPYDYHLRLDSPCIDAGDRQTNASDEPDIYNNRANIGAYGATEEATLSLPVIFNNKYEQGTSISFGKVRINTPSAEDVIIENRGHYKLTIDSVVFSSNNFTPDSTENDDGIIIPSYAIADIEPGGSATFSILFRPTELREYVDTVWIYSNDDRTVPMIRMTGTGTNSEGSFESNTTIISRNLEFGRRQIGAEHILPVSVFNRGETNLTITNVTFQRASEFSSDFNDDITVAPGESGIIQFEFSPTRPESYSEPASISTDDVTLQVNFIGRGFGPSMLISVDSLFFGYAYFDGDVLSDTIWVYNSGDSNLTVDGASFTGDFEAFAIDFPENDIVPLDSGRIILYFDPPAADVDYEAELTISSPNYPIDHVLGLYGRGMAEPGNYMFGHVSGVWEWNDNSSDYIILDSVYVPAYQRLKIEAGARILFEPNAFLQADGEVRCAGTITDSIYFMPRNQSGSDDARWSHLELDHSDLSRLSYCVIQGSNNGLIIRESSPLIEFSTIRDNGIGNPDDSEHDGGAVYLENSGAHLTTCIIESNVARYGGGIFVLNSLPTITNCVIQDNDARQGGGIYLRFQSGARIQSNIIYNNRATEYGDGITVLQHSSPYIVNNTIVSNGGHGIYSGIRSIPALVNNIIWDNDTSIVLRDDGNVLVSYCDVEGDYIGTENINIDPQFVNQSDHDYRLADGSPLIDKGNPEDSHRDWSRPPAKGEVRNDIGAYGGPLSGNWELSTVNLTVFQNPAFPQWMDIYATSFDPMIDPTCSVKYDGNDVNVTLTEIDPLTFHGSYEFETEGTLYISVETTIGNENVSVGRTFELIFIDPNRVRTLILADSRMTIPIGASSSTMSVLGSVDLQPIKPTNNLLFLTPQYSFTGINQPLREPAELAFTVSTGIMGLDDQSKLGLYRRTDSGWTRLESNYNNGQVTGKTFSGGQYAVAWDESFNATGSRPIPETMELISAFPNPFNSTVTIQYSLGFGSDVRLAIYDISGRHITDLVSRFMPAGQHVSLWNGSDAANVSMPSGVYIMRLETAEISRSIKLLLVR